MEIWKENKKNITSILLYMFSWKSIYNKRARHIKENFDIPNYKTALASRNIRYFNSQRYIKLMNRHISHISRPLNSIYHELLSKKNVDSQSIDISFSGSD